MTSQGGWRGGERKGDSSSKQGDEMGREVGGREEEGDEAGRGKMGNEKRTLTVFFFVKDRSSFVKIISIRSKLEKKRKVQKSLVVLRDHTDSKSTFVEMIPVSFSLYYFFLTYFPSYLPWGQMGSLFSSYETNKKKNISPEIVWTIPVFLSLFLKVL